MLKDKIYKSDFLKYTLVLVSGTVLAQLIPVLLQPILRRIYTPEQFGLFAVYSSIFSMLVVIAAGKYETTVVVPKEDAKASYLVLGSIIISFIFSLFCLVCFVAFNDQIVSFFELPEAISSWLYFIPLSILFISIFRALNNWLIRKKQFKKSSFNKIVRRATEGISQVILGLFHNGTGLIIGNIIGDFFNLIVTFLQSKKSDLIIKFNKIELKKVLLNYKDYPLYSSLPSLLNAISLFLPVLIINKFYSQESTGHFDLSRQMLALPLALISTTVSQVLLQKVAEQKNEARQISSFVLKLSAILLSLSVIGGSIVYFFGPQLFSLIFGNDWLVSGKIAQILVFSYCIKFIVSPLSTIFISLEKIKVSSMWQVFYFGLICILFLLEDLDLEHFLTYYVIIDIVAYSLYFVLILITSKKYDRQLAND